MTNTPSTADPPTPLFDEALDKLRAGDYPGFESGGVAYLRLILESAGSATPDALVVSGKWYPTEVVEEIHDQRKVGEFLRLWVALHEKKGEY